MRVNIAQVEPVKLTMIVQSLANLGALPVHRGPVLATSARFLRTIMGKVLNHNCMTRREAWMVNPLAGAGEVATRAAIHYL